MERVISIIAIFLYRVSWGRCILWLVNSVALLIPVCCRSALVNVGRNVELFKFIGPHLLARGPHCTHCVGNWRDFWGLRVERLRLRFTPPLQVLHVIFHLELLIDVDALLEQCLHRVGPVVQVFVIAKWSHHDACSSVMLCSAVAWLLVLWGWDQLAGVIA